MSAFKKKLEICIICKTQQLSKWVLKSGRGQMENPEIKKKIQKWHDTGFSGFIDKCITLFLQ